MARKDWDELQARFLADHHETGITPKDWCKREALNFASAKRYIKIAGYKSANSQKKSSQKSANSQTPKCKKEPAGQRPGAPAGNCSPRTTGANITPSDFGISEQQALFADHIVQGKTRVEAYRLAGYIGEGNTAYSNASRLLRNARVARYVHALRNERQKRYSIELDDLITQLTAIVNADPNALSQYRHVNCRYCWGEGHKYQWRDIEEQLRAEKRAELDKQPPPDVSGGIGFVDNADPNPDCPRCLGEGKGEAYFPDTRDIEGDERHLYQGVKLTMNGVQIVIADKDAARRELARLLAVRGADARQIELNLQRLELQNDKLRAEVEDLRRKAPPPDDDTQGQIAPEMSPQDAEIQYSRILK